LLAAVAFRTQSIALNSPGVHPRWHIDLDKCALTVSHLISD
jgi:hypothetical protein